MRRCAALAFAGVISLGVCRPGAGQPPAEAAGAEDAQTTTLSAQSTLVVVPALVRTKAGQLVFTLTANDFILTDDGVEQKLRLEEDTGGEPLALVIVIEGGGAGARELDKYRALPTMLESLVGGVPHKVAVVAFDSRPELFQEFTPDLAPVDKAVDDLVTGDSGDNGAAILDALGFALDMLRRQPLEYRRAILLVSETLDRGSRMKLDDALKAIGDTNTAIYSIGFSTGKSESANYARRELGGQEPGPPHGCMGKDPNPDRDAPTSELSKAYDCLGLLAPPLALAKMAAIAATDGLRKNIPETVARLTGGEYFKLTDEKSLERDLATISNHVPNRYVLSFQPQAPHPGFHAIGLKLRDYPNLEVTARDGYWADAGAPSAVSR